MTNTYFIQLVGMLLILAGGVALTVSARLFGTSLTREEKSRAGGDWDRKGRVYKLPINLETLASAAFLAGGLGILSWTKFNLCAFLIHWLPNLPEAVRLMFACR
jgi:hypothetical protein